VNTKDLKKLFDGTTAPPWELWKNKAGNCTIRQVGSSGYLSPWIASARDAALIVAAVNALPELLAMAEENARLKAELAEVEGKCKVLSYVHEGAVTHARKYLQEQLDVTIDPIDMSDAIDTYLQVVIRTALKEPGQ
jgi:hypothetical protein